MYKHVLTNVVPRIDDSHSHTRHTELADIPKPSVRCPGEP